MKSIGILKICGKFIAKPLGIIFQSGLDNWKFHLEWQKTNVVPIFFFLKKKKQSELKNYRPISLLPVSGKVIV